MNILEIIAKKQANKELNENELSFIVTGFLNGQISEEEMTEFLKAVVKNSMTEMETSILTKIMMDSGDKIDLEGLSGVFVDKHSSGGVSDSTTLVIAPLVACLSLNVLKMSGRALGHTGGTADKLEVFEGYKVEIPIETAKKLAEKNGACLISQSLDLVPADKKIYALRDKTNTVSSLPLIASSIMSKKLASGASIIALDVKFGSGALMKTRKEAISLARLMKKIGENNNRKVVCFVTNMTEPLGSCVGDTLEVGEAQMAMLGEKSRLLSLSKKIAEELCFLATKKSRVSIRNDIEKEILSGNVFKKFQQIVSSQGGKFENISEKVKSFNKFDVESKECGFVKKIDAERIGNLVHNLKEKFGKDAGVILRKRVGSRVKKGDVLLTIVAAGKEKKTEFENCFVLSKIYHKPQKLISKII